MISRGYPKDKRTKADFIKQIKEGSLQEKR